MQPIRRVNLREQREACHATSKVMIPQVEPGELARRLRDARPPHLLDVRQPEEHAFVHLPGSRLIPLGDLPGRAGELDAWRDEEIVVYCHHGVRSQHAIAFLSGLGFSRLLNLSGGIDRWAVTVDRRMPRY
jgi:rhodanese-related sulfurtransferase